MKKYRCVFTYQNGRTTIEVQAADAEQALLETKVTVGVEVASVEIWDDTGLVLQRKTVLQGPCDDGTD